MGCGCGNLVQQIFDHHMVSTRSGKSDKVSSGVAQAQGNSVTVSALVINVAAVSTLTFTLEGSMEGVSWTEVTSFTQNSFGYNTVSSTSWDYPLIRLRVEVTGTNADALFSAWISQACL